MISLKTFFTKPCCSIFSTNCSVFVGIACFVSEKYFEYPKTVKMPELKNYLIDTDELEFDEKKISLQKIKDIIKELGYQAQL